MLFLSYLASAKEQCSGPITEALGTSAKLLLYSCPVISCHFLHFHKVTQFGIPDLCSDICPFLEQENFSFPVFFPAEFFGHRSLADYTPWGRRVRHDLVTEQQLYILKRSILPLGTWKLSQHC